MRGYQRLYLDQTVLKVEDAIGSPVALESASNAIASAHLWMSCDLHCHGTPIKS